MTVHDGTKGVALAQLADALAAFVDELSARSLDGERMRGIAAEHASRLQRTVHSCIDIFFV